MTTDESQRPWFIFAGGGTGGHLCPALAVLHEIKAIRPDVDALFLCTDRPIDRKILGEAGVEAVPQDVRPFSSRPWRWPGFYRAWRGALRRCHDLFRQRRPGAVLGGGGYASGPAVRAAVDLGIPSAILNPDCVPGRANRWLGRRVDRVFAQWARSNRYFRNANGFRAWGCPVRAGFLMPREALRAAGCRHFGLQADRQTLLVTGASQGARTVNDAMLALAAELAAMEGWQILHLAGSLDADRVRHAYEAAGVSAAVVAFTDRMPEAMAAADLVVSRAGASTLAEITAVGLPSVLLPYPFHRDEHQRHNAEALVEAGAAMVLRDRIDARENAHALRVTLLRLMRDPPRLAAMAEAARRLGRPEAARQIAMELLRLAGHGPTSPPRGG